MAVEIAIRETLPRSSVRGLKTLLRRLGAATLRHQGVRGRDLSILVTDDTEMRELNRGWRDIDRTTDVLSFEGEGGVLGDVVISLEQAERQAERLEIPREEEIARLLVHGILHLLGHDHRNTAERQAMNELTESILNHIHRNQ